MNNSTRPPVRDPFLGYQDTSMNPGATREALPPDVSRIIATEQSARMTAGRETTSSGHRMYERRLQNLCSPDAASIGRSGLRVAKDKAEPTPPGLVDMRAPLVTLGDLFQLELTVGSTERVQRAENAPCSAPFAAIEAPVALASDGSAFLQDAGSINLTTVIQYGRRVLGSMFGAMNDDPSGAIASYRDSLDCFHALQIAYLLRTHPYETLDLSKFSAKASALGREALRRQGYEIQTTAEGVRMTTGLPISEHDRHFASVHALVADVLHQLSKIQASYFLGSITVHPDLPKAESRDTILTDAKQLLNEQFGYDVTLAVDFGLNDQILLRATTSECGRRRDETMLRLAGDLKKEIIKNADTLTTLKGDLQIASPLSSMSQPLFAELMGKYLLAELQKEGLEAPSFFIQGGQFNPQTIRIQVRQCGVRQERLTQKCVEKIRACGKDSEQTLVILPAGEIDPEIVPFLVEHFQGQRLIKAQSGGGVSVQPVNPGLPQSANARL
jgi:hypothetical protein